MGSMGSICFNDTLFEQWLLHQPPRFFLFFFYPIILEIIHYGNPVTQPVPWNRFGGFEPISLGLMIGHSVYTLQKGLK